ncbi:MAG: thioredoxin domain-containing protein [Gemmatimonadaceae bacterium]
MLALFATVAACAKGDERVDSVRAASADSAPGATIPTAEVPAVAPPKQHDSAVASAPPKATTPVASPAAPVGPTRPAAPRRIMAGSLDITSIGYDRGNPAAPVVVVEFSDFGCPYCAEFALQTFPALDSEYIATGKVLFKYVPFLVGTFRNSAEVTRAAECVGEQRAEQYWPMMTAVYGSQAGWKGRGSPDTLLLTLARSAHADSARFAMCYADRHTDARIKAGTDAADYVGVRVTPSFLVDQRPVQGALPLVEFRKLIDAALLLSRSRD